MKTQFQLMSFPGNVVDEVRCMGRDAMSNDWDWERETRELF